LDGDRPCPLWIKSGQTISAPTRGSCSDPGTSVIAAIASLLRLFPRSPTHLRSRQLRLFQSPDLLAPWYLSRERGISPPRRACGQRYKGLRPPSLQPVCLWHARPQRPQPSRGIGHQLSSSVRQLTASSNKWAPRSLIRRVSPECPLWVIRDRAIQRQC